MIGKRLVNTGVEAPLDPLQNFETVTYTGNGGTQKITGYIRKGAAFNGSSSKIDITNSSFNITTYSLSAWIYSSNYNQSNVTFFNNGLDSNGSQWGGLAFGVNANKVFYYGGDVTGVGGSGFFTQTGTTNITDGTWVHVAIIVNGTSITGYINGTQDTGLSRTLGANIVYRATPQNTIGVRAITGGSFGWYNGKIDQVRFFNKALSSGEVTTLYGETYASSTKSTTDIFGDSSGVALYELDEDANDTGVPIDSGQSAVFNGSNSTMVLPLYNRGGNNDWSMSAWVNIPSDISGTIFAFFDGSVSYDQHLFFNLYQGKLQIGTYGSVAYSANTIPKNEWVHLAFTINTSSNVKGYVNGQEVINTTFATLNLKNEAPYIGSTYNNSSFFNGKIDEIRIYGDVLTPTEIDYIVGNTVNIPSDNLLAHYKLDGNGNDETTNYSATSVNNITYSDPAAIAYNGTPTNVNFLGMAFQPDLVWVKNRSSSGNNNALFDSVRGVKRELRSDTIYGEEDYTATNYSLKSYDANGFTVGDITAGNYNVNGAVGGTYSGNAEFVAWCWKAGGAAVSNTDGSITSIVSANQLAGFSIVSYTGNGSSGATVGHGLSQEPEYIIPKNRDAALSWVIGATPIGKSYILDLANGNPRLSRPNQYYYDWNSTTITMGSEAHINGLNNKIIAYCFHSVAGYSKIGTYEGLGTSTVTVSDVGFKPSFIMIKNIDATANWGMYDLRRSTVPDRANGLLYPNLANAEVSNSSTYYFDMNDNGFVVSASNHEQQNKAGRTYLYMVFK